MKYLTLVLLLICSFKLSAQTDYNNLNYTYDQAGNRISRYLQVTLNKKSSSDTSLAQPEKIVVRNKNNNLETVSYSIYPNPTSASLNVDFKGIQIGSDLKIILTDAYGRLVIEKLCTVEGNYSLELSELISGVYFVTIISNHQKNTYKIVKI